MQSRFAITIAAIAFLFSLEAVACGDSLYRVGKGVSYRVYTAPLPGSVLVYGDSEGAKQLAEALAQSGHGVHLVENETDLAVEMEKGGYDVVIAPYSEHEAVEARQADSGAEFIPVALSEEEEEAAKQSYNRVLVADKDEIKHYLKAIHKSLKSKA
jgi:predicted dinucleotide-binding enzyme